MTDKIFLIEGVNISSFIIDETSLKFSSEKFDTYAQFQENWAGESTLVNKTEIKFDTIFSVNRKTDTDEFSIKHLVWGSKKHKIWGNHLETTFSFLTPQDADIFLDYFTNTLNYQKSDEALAATASMKDDFIGAALVIGMIVAFFGKITIAMTVVIALYYLYEKVTKLQNSIGQIIYKPSKSKVIGI